MCQRTDAPGGLKAVHDRHLDIHEDGKVISGFAAAEFLHGLLAVPGRVHLQFTRGQEGHRDFQVESIVFHQQHAFAVEPLLWIRVARKGPVLRQGKQKIV